MKTRKAPAQQADKRTRTGRGTPVHVVMRRRGNACLVVAGILGAYLAMVLLGSGGRWSTWHTWLTLAVALAAAAALACYLAATARAPRVSILAALDPAPQPGDSPVTHPGVTHLHPVAVLTPLKQEK